MFCEEDKDAAIQLQQQLLQQQQRTTETKQKRVAPRKPSLDRAPAPEQAWEKPKQKRASGRRRMVVSDMETGDELPRSRDHSRDTDTESIISQHLYEQPPSQYAGELEVELIIQDKDDIAKETLTTEDIKMLYLSGKLKYRMHENCAIEEDQLRLVLSKGKIKEDRNNLILLD